MRIIWFFFFICLVVIVGVGLDSELDIWSVKVGLLDYLNVK